MRWAMRSWSRIDRLNRLPGGTWSARRQMDYRPGRACAAHFTVSRRSAPRSGDETASLLRAGERLQRFWLTATRLGLAMQPSLAPICFAQYGRRGIAFTADRQIQLAAAGVAAELSALCPGDPEGLIFMGRIGWPATRRVGARSIRLPVETLMAR
jgi:hypothetical protein